MNGFSDLATVRRRRRRRATFVPFKDVSPNDVSVNDVIVIQ